MNLRVLVLASCTFAVGTGTFVVAGLLGAVSGDLSVSVGAAGHLVTVFAVAYAVGSPVLVAAPGRVGGRRLLVASLLVFALANAAAAVVPTYPLLLASRVAAACGAAVLTPVASAVAAELVSPAHRGRALSVVVGGLSVSWVVGVPLGTLVGDLYGWRVTFLLVAALALSAALAVGTLVPNVESPPPQGLASRLSVAVRPAVLVVLGVTTLGLAATFVVLTYVRPVLEAITGFGPAGIGAMFFLFGLASIAGTVLGGHGADRLGYRANAVPILVVLALSLLSFSLLFGVGAGTTPAILGVGVSVVAWCVAGYALLPLQQHRLLAAAPDNTSGALSLNASAIYAGQGLGAIVGSLVLANSSLAALGLVGALCTLVALGVLPGPSARLPLPGASRRRGRELRHPARRRPRHDGRGGRGPHIGPGTALGRGVPALDPIPGRQTGATPNGHRTRRRGSPPDNHGRDDVRPRHGLGRTRAELGDRTCAGHAAMGGRSAWPRSPTITAGAADAGVAAGRSVLV